MQPDYGLLRACGGHERFPLGIIASPSSSLAPDKPCSEFGQLCRIDAPAPAVLRAKLKVRYFELSVPALPRCLELLLDEAGIVVPLLCLERLLQPEQRTRVAGVVV